LFIPLSPRPLRVSRSTGSDPYIWWTCQFRTFAFKSASSCLRQDHRSSRSHGLPRKKQPPRENREVSGWR
jgi:hypothetical protein